MIDENKLFNDLLNTHDLSKFIDDSKKILKQNKKMERNNSTYFEREKKKENIKRIRKQFEEDFEKIRVSTDATYWHDQIEHYIENKNNLTEYEKKKYLIKANSAFSKNNHEALEDILYEIKKPYLKRGLEWYKTQIIKILGCPPKNTKEIENILVKINTYHEADIVLSAIESSGWLNRLKNKPVVRNTYKEKYRLKHRIPPLKYKIELKRNRVTLQKQLKKIGTGVGRAKPISKILYYI